MSLSVREKSEKKWPGLYDRFDALRKVEGAVRPPMPASSVVPGPGAAVLAA